MKWKLVGALLLVLGLLAAWQANQHFHDQTRLIIEVSITIVFVGVGLRLLFPGTED